MQICPNQVLGSLDFIPTWSKSHELSAFERRGGREFRSVIYHIACIATTIDSQHVTNHLSDCDTAVGEEMENKRDFESSKKKKNKTKQEAACESLKI